MTVTKKLIGRLPILLGEYDSTKIYSKRQRVTLYGSEFESKVDNNSIAPATLNNGNLTINTDNWRVVSNGSEAFLAGEKLDTIEFDNKNPQYVFAMVDNSGKVLAGIEKDGNPYFGYGVPKQIKTVIDKINTDLVDKYKKSNPNDEEGNVIDTNTIVSVEDNPEYIKALTDSVGKLIEAIGLDGVRKFFAGINIQGVSQCVTDNPEYIVTWLDNQNRIVFGFKINGDPYFGYGVPSQIVEYVNDKITPINGSVTAIEAFLEGFTDTTLLYYLNENYGEYIDDIENRIEVKTDSKKKIISYRSEDGMLHESVGINTPVLMAEKIISPSIDDVELTTATDTIYVERPKFGEIWFEGNLPTDMSDNRTPSWLTMTFKNSGVAQFKCNCTLAIQGHGSATYSKKGYTLEPYNANKEHISIKFGDMIAIDSFHLKAYATDSLHCRDMANFNIWRNIIQSLGYPYSKMNNIPYELTDSYNKNIIDIADAKYAPDGFPCVCYLNGKFLGLYTIKLKKSRQNYAMEKSIKSEIFLDATNEIVGGVSVSSLNTQFIYEGWDLKNPKLKKYEEGGEIPDANVLASIERLFDFTSSWDSSDQTSIKGYENYIVLPHWLAFVIFEELVFSEDSVRNNINVVTWDNTHWSVIPYDTDLSYGLHAWNHTLYGPDRMNKFVQDGDIWPAFRSLFQIQLRELWTSLRRSGVITFEKIYGAYKAQCDSIPRDIYADDYKKWGTIWQNGIPSMEQLATNIAARIEWLDSQWLNQNN